MTKNPISLVLSGGGSGGHLSPLVALATHFLAKHPSCRLVFAGSHHGPEAQQIPPLGVEFIALPTPRLRRYWSWKTLVDLATVPFALFAAFVLLLRIRPVAVVTSGGYVGVPVAVAAVLLRIPLIIHEQVLVPGLANSVLAHFAERVAISFPESSSYFPPDKKLVLTGNPVRQMLLAGKKVTFTKNAPLSQAWLDDNKLPLIYVTGSYQGAHAINRFVGRHLKELVGKAKIVHQCGVNTVTEDAMWLAEQRKKLPPALRERYCVIETVSVDMLAVLYRKAVLVVSRAGASTVSELCAVGKASFLVPYPGAARSEQLRLAEYIAREGAGVCWQQNTLLGNEDAAVNALLALVSDKERLAVMAKNARTLGRRNATEQFAHIVEEYLCTK